MVDNMPVLFAVAFKVHCSGQDDCKSALFSMDERPWLLVQVREQIRFRHYWIVAQSVHRG